MNTVNLLLGNCLDTLRTLPDNSVDSVVTDPPYGLSFMSKAWDYEVPSVEIWKEALRVLKPGGALLAFGGTRTYHRLVVNIEDAGFEIRDQIMWIYGSGFPKSMDISKAIDKEAGVVREVLGTRPAGTGPLKTGHVNSSGGGLSIGTERSPELSITEPTSDEAKKWSGYGTALKPANEPICLARKPLSEKTVAKNVLKHGVGGLNVDASRIGSEVRTNQPASSLGNAKTMSGGAANPDQEGTTVAGRFPANILFDEYAAGVLDEQSGVTKSTAPKKSDERTVEKAGNSLQLGKAGLHSPENSYSDGGGASRFFYVAKASKKDRGEGNTHPTVKPIKLMEYLVKLVTPEGGTVLDPFMGSGTTGVAAKALGFGFVGCELDENYLAIAKKRIEQ